MKTKYQIYQVDSFTKERFSGNPAGVVLNADGLSDLQMQRIARELNNSETAFLLAPDSDDHAIRIRFFTPIAEVPSCSHATIAAHFVRAVENKLPSCTVMHKIGIGVLPVEILYHDGIYKIIMIQGSISFSQPFADQIKGEILSAIGLSNSELDERCPIQIVSTGHSKVLVGIKTRQTLNALQPNLSRLTEISKLIDCNGYFVFTLDSDADAVLTHGRMFAPAIAIPEDPVTGNANGPLGAYLVRHGLVNAADGVFKFNAKQGEAIGRPGIVEVEVEIEHGEPVRTKVGGHAVIVYQTEIEL